MAVYMYSSMYSVRVVCVQAVYVSSIVYRLCICIVVYVYSSVYMSSVRIVCVHAVYVLLCICTVVCTVYVSCVYMLCMCIVVFMCTV